MSGITVKGFFEGLEPMLNLKPERFSGMNCVYCFIVGDFSYNVSLKDGKAAVTEGRAASPNCTIMLSENDFIDMLNGKLDAQAAFFTGRLKVAGDMGLALKLGAFIK
ncbi:MAG: SCP2 sterol-binding domain-containing protein [Syntrophorhabdaceae bacterium]|nr:SCP2 sterol-binding domain-containing protein [Syntrophorhabdaceae bacterium]